MENVNAPQKKVTWKEEIIDYDGFSDLTWKEIVLGTFGFTLIFIGIHIALVMVCE